MMFKKFILTVCAAAACGVAAWCETVEYRAEVTAGITNGSYAPYMIGSWTSGRYVAGKAVYQGASAVREFDLSRRFSWSYGAEYSLGYSNTFSYERFTADEPAAVTSTGAPAGTWGTSSYRTSAARLIQLFAAIKYRMVFLQAGMKEERSPIVDGSLSAGDLVRSNNARPIPGVTAGFIDFVDIPLTRGWVQIGGVLMYGRLTDNGFRSAQFNRYQGLLSQDLNYTYKRCHFRTNPAMPLSVTVGMQTAGFFGGSTTSYQRGRVKWTENRGFHLRDLWDMFFPLEGSGEDYYKGSSLGSWDFKARYNIGAAGSVSLYFEWPWEDGSGIGRRNGWDGLWGVQYDFGAGMPVESVVIEYLDFTNQSGPTHFTGVDHPGTDMNVEANGADNYWNNGFYGAYANYGMAIGTPFVLSPVYNTDGSPNFDHNRARGFHAAAKGSINAGLHWRAMFGYQKAGGAGTLPSPRKLHCTSAMLEARWKPAHSSLPGFELKAQTAFDAGNLRGNNFGVLVGISYSGSLNF